MHNVSAAVDTLRKITSLAVGIAEHDEVRKATLRKLGKYGLAYVLFTLFLLSWAGQWWFAWREHVADATTHGQQPLVAEYVNIVMAETLANWQSEFLQLFTFVTLTMFLVAWGSSESKTDSSLSEARIRAAAAAQFEYLTEQITLLRNEVATLGKQSDNSTDASSTEPNSGDPTPNDADYA